MYGTQKEQSSPPQDRGYFNAALFDQDRNTHFVLLILLVIAVITFYPLANVGYTTQDDSITALWSFQDALDTSVTQARILHFLAAPLYLLPYAIDNFVYYKVLSLLPIITSIIVFACLIGRLLPVKSYYFPALLTLFFLTFIQNMWYHSLLTSYPFLFTVSINLLLISIILMEKYLVTRESKYKIIGAAIFFLSLLSYEMFVGYFAVLFGLCYYRYTCSRYVEFKGVVWSLRVLSYHLTALVIYIVIYVVFRMMTNPNPDSSSVTLNISILPFLNTLYQFSVSSLPTYAFLHYGGLFSEFSESYASYHYSVIYFIKNCRVEWIIKALLSSYLVFYLLRLKAVVFSRSGFILTVVSALFLILWPNVLVALTPQKQGWAANGDFAYTTTFFSYYGTALLFSTLIAYLNQLLLNYGSISQAYMALMVICIPIGSLATDYSNYYVAKSQRAAFLKWETVNHFLESSAFRSLPEDAVIFAPTLWTRINLMANPYYYWTNYINKKTGKNVTVTRKMEDLDGHPGTVYFLKYLQQIRDENQFLVFAPLNSSAFLGGWNYLYSDSAHVFTYSKNKKYTLFLGFKDKGPKDVVVDEESYGRVSTDSTSIVVNKEKDNDILTHTVVEAKDIDLDSILLSDYINTTLPRSIVMEFQDGFYDAESSERRYWRWCRSEGVMVVTNTSPENKSVRLEMTFAAKPSNLSIESSLFSERIHIEVKSQFFSKVISMPPGEHRIRFVSDAEKTESPNDPRELVFMLLNPRVEVVPSY